MKKIMIVFTLICLAFVVNAQTKNKKKMKLNAGIISTKLAESKAFYTGILGFGVTFENEFYLLLHTPDRSDEISFRGLAIHRSNPCFIKVSRERVCI